MLEMRGGSAARLLRRTRERADVGVSDHRNDGADSLDADGAAQGGSRFARQALTEQSPFDAGSQPVETQEETNDMSTTREQKLAAIQEFFAAYGEHDRDRIGAVLAASVTWTIPGHHPLSGTKHGVDEVLAFFDALAAAGMKAETYFLEASDEYVVDIHRGWSTAGEGEVNTDWALVWHFDDDGKVDRVTNLSGDQHQMDSYIWANFELAPLPQRLAQEAERSPTS